MEILAVIVVVLVTLWVIGKWKGDPDPTKMSDVWLANRHKSESAWTGRFARASLERPRGASLEKAYERRRAYMKQIEGELARRGISNVSAYQTELASEELRNEMRRKLPAVWLRALADRAYAEVWKAGKVRGDSDKVCHESAILNVFIKRYEEDAGAATFPLDEMIRATRWEAMPFILLPRSTAKEAVAEYLVWREYPDKAKMEVLHGAIDNLLSHLKQNNDQETLDNLSSKIFAYIPWTRLLPNRD